MQGCWRVVSGLKLKSLVCNRTHSFVGKFLLLHTSNGSFFGKLPFCTLSLVVRVPNLYFGDIQYSWGTWLLCTWHHYWTHAFTGDASIYYLDISKASILHLCCIKLLSEYFAALPFKKEKTSSSLQCMQRHCCTVSTVAIQSSLNYCC